VERPRPYRDDASGTLDLSHRYRAAALLTLIAFQILSGLTLVSSRLQQQDTLLGTLQTMTGIYVAVFFLGHLTAVFAARHAGIDTNWNWLTDSDRGLLSDLRSLSLVAHYWVGPIAIVTHLACGLRALMLQHHARRVPTASRSD
jgi:heme A synthase